MTAPGRYINPLKSICSPNRPICLLKLHNQQIRTAVASANAAKYKRKDEAAAQKKKKKASADFRQYNLKDAQQFSLCDAIRYIRAFEVGNPPSSAKYSVAVKLRTQKNGPVLRNRLRLPHPVKTDIRICVICPPESKAAAAAKASGAVLVGEENVFDAVKDGHIEFERCICHVDSVAKMNKAGLGRILGPKGLMPSAKFGTVVKDVEAAMRDLVGGSEYRERVGVVRMAVGQLGFTPEELQRNIRSFMDSVKKDCNLLSDKVTKEVYEVVLSSSHSPGFSLNGEFRSPTSVSSQALSTS